MKKYENNIDKE